MSTHPKIAMRRLRGMTDPKVISGPWRAPLRKRVNWRVVGALAFAAVWVFIFGVTVGVILS